MTDRRSHAQAGPPSHRKPDIWLAVAAGLGTILSAYLVYTRAAHAPVYCPLGSGCDIVQSSRYAAVFGLPVALLGLLFYGYLVMLAVRPVDPGRRWILALPVAAGGVASSAVFIAVQQTIIKATCSLCLLSAALTIVILLLLLRQRPARVPARTWGWTAVAAVAAAGLLVGGYVVSAPRSAAAGYAEGLARHLTASGVKFYGAYWCPHCTDQKAMFGKAQRYLPYVECDARSPIGQPQVCAQAEIRAFPTWDIGGNRYEGVLSLEDLARLTGFPVPP